MVQHLCSAFIVMALFSAPLVRAQDLESEPEASSSPSSSPGAAPEATAEKDIEELYDKEDTKQERKDKPRAQLSKDAPKEVETLSDLATLQPFSDVAVIQRRFLPKTKRFELTGTAFSNLNNPFFNSIGLTARAAYYLQERYAVELIGAFASTSSRQVTDDLEKPAPNGPGITTDNVVTSKGYYVAAFKWNPIYGKITWLNKEIVPFDMNFSAGFGMTMTTADESEPTIHMGTSQVFAISKGMAFRWDIAWNMYQATIKNDTTGATEKLSQNDLFLGLGMSFYFPEATYR